MKKGRRLETPKVRICIGRDELLLDGRMQTHEDGELEIEAQRPMDLLFSRYYLGNLCAL